MSFISFFYGCVSLDALFGSRKESVLDAAQLHQSATFIMISYLLHPIKHVFTISSTLKG